MKFRLLYKYNLYYYLRLKLIVFILTLDASILYKIYTLIDSNKTLYLSEFNVEAY